MSAKLRSQLCEPSTSHAASTDDDSDESDEWEAVEEAKLPSDEEGNADATSSTAAVKITVDVGGVTKKKEFDQQKFLLAQLKKRQKEIASDIHKVHLLCCLARGLFLNNTICRNPHLLALSLSCWDPKVLEKVSEGRLKILMDVPKLRKLIASARHQFPFKETAFGTEELNVLEALASKRCSSYLELTVVITLMLRSLGLDVRLIYSMQPVPVKDAKIPSSAKRRKSNPSPYFAQAKHDSSAASVGGKARKPTRKRKTESDQDDDESSGESTSDEEDRTTARRRLPGRKTRKRSVSVAGKPPTPGKATPKKKLEKSPIARFVATIVLIVRRLID